MKPTFQWEKVERGWYVDRERYIAVSMEIGGKWASYVSISDTLSSAPRFKTMREAMKDAENRFLERTIR